MDKVRIDDDDSLKVDVTKLNHEVMRSYDANIMWNSLNTAKIEKLLQDCGPAPMVLVLGGSFNPPHIEHIEMLESARIACEKTGLNVVLGILVPSSNSHVFYKSGADQTIVLKHRQAMCELMIKSKPWIISVPWGWASSSEAGRKIGGLIDINLGINTSFLNVWGADIALRHKGMLHDEQSVIVARPPYTDELEQLMSTMDLGELHALVARAEGKARDVSSTAVRELLFNQKVDELCDLDWISPAVIEYCKIHREELTISQDPAFLFDPDN